MKLTTITRALLLASFAGIAGVATAHDMVPGQKQDVLLQNAVVHTVENGVLTDTDVLVQNGKVTAIGKDLKVPAGVSAQDLAGQHIYPSAIALATQLGLIEIEAVRATDDTTEVTDTNPDLNAQISFNADSELLPVTRSNGIGHVEVFPAGRLLMGQSAVMSLDSWNFNDATVKAHVGLHINWPRASVSNSPWVRKSAEDQKADNAKRLAQLKAYFVQAKDYYLAHKAGKTNGKDSRWHAMLPVFDGQLPLYVHADEQRQIEQAVAFAKEQGAKLVIVGGRDSWRVTSLLKANNVAVVYTAPYGLPSREDEDYDQAFKTPKMLEDAGVKYAIALGGSWDNRNLVFAAGMSVNYGLTNEQALRAITLSPAEITGTAGSLGSIKVGKAANLVVSTGDLLDYTGSQVQALYLDGRKVDLNDRQKQLYHKYSQKAE